MSRRALPFDQAVLAPGRPYAERAEEDTRWPDAIARALHAGTVAPLLRAVAAFTPERERLVAAVAVREETLRLLSDEVLRQRAHALRARLRRHGFTLDAAAESFALVRAAAQRTLGQRHFDTQLIGGWALLRGRLMEMATGEGKTFCATLPACAVAMAGYPVHVITVNDYLAQRDAEKMEPLYAYFGFGVGVVSQGMDRAARRAAYAKPVTYVTNKELAFDYLRDGVALQGRSSRLHQALAEEGRDDGPVLRGLYFAIVDEADSVFVDEARTPLILSASSGDEAAAAEQLIELKEGVPPTTRRDTLARLTYQRLFRRYVHLAGMTGTAAEASAEIRSVYGLELARIPLHRPSQRAEWGVTWCGSVAKKWELVAAAVHRVAMLQGRPVLVGTRSVAASEQLSAVLRAFGVPHALLHGRQDAEEGEVVAQAGQPGRVTVVTNMAGRGTDIPLGAGVEARGGLHVILTEYHDSRRVDRQLVGRCARRGDPGSCEAIVSLEDEIFAVCAPRTSAWLRRLSNGGLVPPPSALQALRAWCQQATERRHSATRRANVRQDRQLHRSLAFAGSSE
ncbi:hypothetical protein HHL11_17980 [Ramlibacter sp. G-1-2-2]|uniref:Protein translocase subunit SecA n=1 Tax=Ramlibacter agri TaxID=2728837 RepID=A0A848H504_9BURK|nr:DEAD/DEAH box helicase [Ramlibacter agri]NML45644.1 hypothetical protein [Ramlibacter agri]